MHIYTCTYTHAHIHMHMYTCTYTHAQIHMHIYTCTYTRAHIHMHIYTCTYAHAHIKCTYTHAHINMHIYTCTYTHARTPTSAPPLITLIPWPELLHRPLQIIYFIYYNRSLQIFQKSESHHKILGARMATRSKFHPEGAVLLKAAVQSLVPMVN